MSQRPGKILTENNIFEKGKELAWITRKRRKLIPHLTTDPKIRQFVEEFDEIIDNEEDHTIHDWRLNDDPIGLIEKYNKARLPLDSVTGSSIAAYNYLFNKDDTSPINEFTRESEKLDTEIVDKVVGAAFVPKSNRHFIPKGKNCLAKGEYYDVLWSDLHVRFENIPFMPAGDVRDRFDQYFRENFAEIYDRVMKEYRERLNNPQQIAEITEQNLVKMEQTKGTSGLPSSSPPTKKAKITISPSVATAKLPQPQTAQQQPPPPPIPPPGQQEQQPDDSNTVKPPDNGSEKSSGSQTKVPLNKEPNLAQTVQAKDNPSTNEANTPADNNLAKIDRCRASDKVKLELANFSALALTVIHFKEQLEDQNIFLAVFAHFIPKDSTNYLKIETRVLCFEQLADQSDSVTREKFVEILKHFDLDKKYLVIITREHLKAAFSADKYRWLQCHEEIMDNCLTKGDSEDAKGVYDQCLEELKLKNINAQPKPENPSPLEACVTRSHPLIHSNIIRLNFSTDIANFYEKIKNFTDPLIEPIPQSDLLATWFSLRNVFYDPKSEKPWGATVIKVFSDIVNKLDPIQFTAFFLSPWDFKNWTLPASSDVSIFSDDDHKVKIVKELEKFAKLYSDLPKICSGADAADEDDEHSLQRPNKRQKRLREDLMFHKKRNSNVEVENKEVNEEVKQKRIITDEVERYISLVKSMDEDHLKTLNFWEREFRFYFPFLTLAARFYLSVPSITISSGLLIRKALKQSRSFIHLNIGEDHQYHIIKIINENQWLSEEQISQINNRSSVESVANGLINQNQPENDNESNIDDDFEVSDSTDPDQSPS